MLCLCAGCDGELREVAVLTEAFDLERLQDDVRYLDNRRSLDSTVLQLPEPVEALEL